MKKYIVIVCCLFSVLYGYGQKVWSLRECIDFAIRNNVEIKQQELQVKSAEVDLSTSRNSRLPDLNGSVSQSFNFGQSPDETGVYKQQNSANTQFSASTSLPVFTGFKIPNQIKQNQFDLKAETEGLDKAKQNLELQITSYYLDILFKQEILKVYKEQAILTEMQVDRTDIMVQSGKVARSQLYDIKAQLAKDELNVTVANNDLKNTVLSLVQALNLKSEKGFSILVPDVSSTNLPQNILFSLMTPEEVFQRALEVKPHFREALYKVESSKYGLKVAQSGYWPTVSFGMSYNNAYYHSYNSQLGNESWSNQLKSNHREVVGFTLSIPIFNRFETRNQVRKARLQIQNQEYNLMNVKLNLYKEIQQAYQDAVAAEAKFVSTEKAYDAASESFKYAEERYQIGKSTVFEYNEAQTKLISSRSEQIQAKYDFIFRSKILDFYQGKRVEL